ncbi:hypothetical protein FEF27_09530 [Nesterenkonia sphaerica]|uniref:Cytochrome b561 bacterial/Ni-hydrogenase domain-containing protein n=1 Tax=Nesterenkonia sphaerica TaxID=1804988 RepID=A0A5R9A6K1_9MICC|nr:hypothetical protein FEF27_09530 [Nesterenkonia sphaerica]
MPRTEQQPGAPETQDQTPEPPAKPAPAADPVPPAEPSPPPSPVRRRGGLPRTAEAPAPQRTPAETPAETPDAAPPGGRRRTGLGSSPAPRTPSGPTSEPAPAASSAPAAADVPAGAPAPRAEQRTPAAPASSARPARGESHAPGKPPAPGVSSGVRRTALWAAAGLGGVVVLAGILVLAAQLFVGTDIGSSFLSRYPGQYEKPEVLGGYPWWLNWAHFFNAFLMVLIIKTGIQIRRETKPEAYWTPKWNKKRRISLTIWTHNALDLLWVLNGVVFVVLLGVTGYWSRVVPTSWEVFPNALSAALQYVSLDWPTAGDWAHYNSAQELAYFATIFIAAPLAITTGVRMSGLWPSDKPNLNKAFPVEWARAVHFPVMVYFTAFILVHVILVFATGALRNLNHIYTGQDATNWTGFWLFVLSLIVIIGAALATRPVIIAPVASLFGRVGR